MLLAIALLLSQIIMLSIFIFDRQDLLYRTQWRLLSQRISSIVQLFDSLETNQHKTILKALNSPAMRVRFITENKVSPKSIAPVNDRSANKLYSALQDQLGNSIAIRVINKTKPKKSPLASDKQTRKKSKRKMYRENIPPKYHNKNLRRRKPRHKFIIQLQIANGRWLEFKSAIPDHKSQLWPIKLLLSTIVMLFVMLLVSVFLIRWLVKPLRELGIAADTFGRNIQINPIAESGPTEIRLTARAFNTMQERLQRYIADRSRILSAISHDLKTPITRMRLRTELLNDNNIKNKYIHDLEEMEAMVSETLEFMRGEQVSEAMVQIDLNALLEALQADREELGQSLTIIRSIHKPISGRLIALKRCINNLLDNANRFAEKTSIESIEKEDTIIIKVIDNGPGIPEQLLEQVFNPFEQLDKSRTKNGNGFGLGLGIARNIARGHGGDLALSNCKTGGLIAEITLPK